MKTKQLSSLSPYEIKNHLRKMGKWFHNINLKGVLTAPEHFLGDYPAVKWRRFARSIPARLAGKSVLDVGCNAGFYCLEMKKRGAGQVLGIDTDETYLAQARFAAEVLGEDIEFRNLSVYDIASLTEKFDIVLFMGVFYHLRYPLLALDLLRKHVVRELLVFQSMQRGSEELMKLKKDYQFSEEEIFQEDSFPKMHFIEEKYSGDPTNWWIPNRACSEALLRSAGFKIVSHPEREVYICRPARLDKEKSCDILPFEINPNGGIKPWSKP
jgi:tRNA (mo5U34)-methyltransferase